jgi:exodeoxyribonuclease VII large subunit
VNRQVVSVQLLTSYLRQLVESDELLSDLWVEGEVSETFAARSGHVYFTLRDTDAQLKCVLFRAQAQRMRSLPRAGDHIAAHGRVSVYEREGAYQLYVDFVQPAGLGIQALQLELLRQQLAAEGLFDASRKRAIPAMPSCIGVVTSAEGAVWHDIQNVLRRRFPLVHLLLAPTPVQGESAPAGIVDALRALQDDGRPDVIIVARGGGSVEDLWCFNDERVARAVFACKVPVVSGVGHETDWTLIDDVADLRAPTPSAAAELCSPSILDLALRISDLRRDALRSIVDRTAESRAAAARLEARLIRLDPMAQFSAARASIATDRQYLFDHMNRMLADARSSVAVHSARAKLQTSDRFLDSRHDLNVLTTRLQTLSPAGVLRRGYAHVTAGDDGRVVRGVDDVAPRERIVLRVEDGVIVGNVVGAVRREPIGREVDRRDA